MWRINIVKGLRGSNFIFGLLLVIILSFGLIGGCGSSGGNSNQTTNNIQFIDITSQAGLSYAHSFATGGPVGEPQLISGGVAAGDYDKDGWADLYVTRGSIGPNLLLENLGNGTFKDVGATAGVDLSGIVTSGPTFADFSGDGFLDLFLGGISPTKISLFINNGNETFSDITASLDGILSRNTFSVAFGDYDLDNDLDFFMTHWGSGTVSGSSEHLWRNNGDSTFTDVSTESGISATYQGAQDFTFAPNFADINNDGYPDSCL